MQRYCWRISIQLLEISIQTRVKRPPAYTIKRYLKLQSQPQSLVVRIFLFFFFVVFTTIFRSFQLACRGKKLSSHRVIAEKFKTIVAQSESKLPFSFFVQFLPYR